MLPYATVPSVFICTSSVCECRKRIFLLLHVRLPKSSENEHFVGVTGRVWLKNFMYFEYNFPGLCFRQEGRSMLKLAIGAIAAGLTKVEGTDFGANAKSAIC